ncbi:hypothetical protein K438DRAFT_1845320 [Mycena galopus ATCC 62051]|nr:hypothetical protein K438DRAFT_1845320 [Mycena galopus ATCC 62051]
MAPESSRAARRWRAITRAQTKNSDEDIVLASSLVETVFDVMVSAGWKMRDYPSSSRAFIRNQFDPQITAIVKYSLQLRATIGEEIVSEDLEVAYVEPNHIFDKQSMEDTDAVPGRVEGRGRMRDLVVCTTDIGIQKRENRCDSEPEEKRLLLCPKVVLQSTLHESQ